MVVALVAAMLVPTAALAETTNVGGTIPAVVLTITPPEVIALGSLYGTATPATGTSDPAGSVLCTDPDGYALTIASDDSGGYMSLDGAGATDLAAVLEVTAALVQGDGAAVTGGTAITDATVTSTPAAMGSTTAGAPEDDGENSITLSVSQAPQIIGAPGAYSYILTFTASAN